MYNENMNYDDKFEESEVKNMVNLSNLEFIGIYGLFGRYNIEIPFEKQVNIYIGENGLGKTTILNIIYFILDGKFSRLSTIIFRKITVKFKGKALYTITKEDLDPLQKRLYNYNKKLYDSMIYREYEVLDEDIYIDDPSAIEIDNDSYLEIIEMINRKKSLYNKNSSLNELLKAVKNNITDRIIYLPTYRRIEDDFASLNLKSEDFNNAELLIRFGMSDVKNSIDRILDKIRSLAMKGFTEMTGVLLREYADGVNPYDGIFTKASIVELNIETVKIVLDRVGKEIEEKYKQKILELIKNKNIIYPKYHYLWNLINKLVDNYKLQQTYDNRIKKFANTCNKYLNGKYFYYNQSTLNLDIFLDDNKDKRVIELTQLSSGEKQIVSLFSKLYLESNDHCIVIIDEPELSLSIQWQKMLLPDIMRSNKCKLLVTVTHSPFIFDNEFDFDAKEIRHYIEISE